MEMLQLLERQECCSVQQRGSLSKELLGKICFCQLIVLICCRAQVPLVWQGGLLRATASFGSWACAPWSMW